MRLPTDSSFRRAHRQSMRFNVYADLSRELSTVERCSVADALDKYIPDGGCVGRQGGPNDEVYVTVEAKSDEDARIRDSDYMRTVIKECGLGIEFTIELQREVREK